jgi:hypothetical protein
MIIRTAPDTKIEIVTVTIIDGVQPVTRKPVLPFRQPRKRSNPRHQPR